jgi:hypothetical protein
MRLLHRIVISALGAAALSAGALVVAPAAPAVGRPVIAPGTVVVTAAIRVSGAGLHIQVHLMIRLNGQTALNQVVRSPACGPGCATAALGRSPQALRVVDLDGDGSPDVVLGLFSGGAHCCFVDQVYSLDPGTKTFTRTEHQFLDADPQIADLNGDGHYEFVSQDTRIAEAGFSDYADSGAPVQIFAFSGGRFRDVTDSYRPRIVTDAARWLRLFNHHHANGRGLIAAWAADEDRLGDTQRVNATLASALKHGYLAAAPGLGGPSATKFVAQLRTLLHRLGYTH